MSLRTVEVAIHNNTEVVVSALKQSPSQEVFEIGSIASITRAVRVASHQLSLTVEGIGRVRICGVTTDEGVLRCEFVRLDEQNSWEDCAPIVEALRTTFTHYAVLDPRAHLADILSSENIEAFSNAVVTALPLPWVVKQRILEAESQRDRMNIILEEATRKTKVLSSAKTIAEHFSRTPKGCGLEEVHDPLDVEFEAVSKALHTARKRGFDDGYLLGIWEAVEILESLDRFGVLTDLLSSFGVTDDTYPRAR